MIPVALIRVRLTAMNIAAGTPLPETSPMTNPNLYIIDQEEIKKSPPTSFAASIEQKLKIIYNRERRKFFRQDCLLNLSGSLEVVLN